MASQICSTSADWLHYAERAVLGFGVAALDLSSLLQGQEQPQTSQPLPASGGRYNAESALDSLLDDLQEFRADSAHPAPPASSAACAPHQLASAPEICIVSMLPAAPSGASVPVCHGYGHVALELVCREPNHEVVANIPSASPPMCSPELARRPCALA